MKILTIIKFFNILLYIVCLTSCVNQGSKLSKTDCPSDTILLCKPLSWTGSDYDTSCLMNRNYQYILVKLNKINSNNDEWQISSTGTQYFLTTSNSNIQKTLLLNKNRELNFDINCDIEISDNKHFGSIVGISNENVFLSLSNLPNNDLQLIGLSEGIGFSRIYNGKFLNNSIEDLKIINIQSNLEDWIGHPFIYRDNILFFASDMLGGYGGIDIWYIYRINKNEWSQPINCGPNINTPCDELSPFIPSNGKYLLFSSSGHSTIGGYDIFKSNIRENLEIFCRDTNKIKSVFEKAHNIGSPINSQYDELFPFTDSDIDSVLYFSSNRDNDNFDIFALYKDYLIRADFDYTKIDNEAVQSKFTNNGKTKSPKNNFINEASIAKVKLIGKIFDENQSLLIDSAKIDIRKSPEFNIDTILFSNREGKFMIDLNKNQTYRITAYKEQYFYDSKDITIDSSFIGKVVSFYLPLRGELRINFPLDEYNNPYKYTLDSNGDATNRTWQNELDMIADNIKFSLNKIDKVVLVGHTDYLASDEYNFYLGDKRVNFVINELVKRGIPKAILFGRSAGKKELLPRRINEVEENYRKRLRRVTIEKILLK